MHKQYCYLPVLTLTVICDGNWNLGGVGQYFRGALAGSADWISMLILSPGFIPSSASVELSPSSLSVTQKTGINKLNTLARQFN